MSRLTSAQFHRAFRMSVENLIDEADGYELARHLAVERLAAKVPVRDGVKGFLVWLTQEEVAPEGCSRLALALTEAWTSSKDDADLKVVTGKTRAEWLALC